MNEQRKRDEITPDHLEIVGWDAEDAARALVDAVASALPRVGLTDREKRELAFDAERVASRLRAFRNAPYRGAVIDLTMSALFVGLRAVLTEERVADLRKASRSEIPREAGKESGKRRAEEAAARRAYVATRAKALQAKYPKLTQERLASKICETWDTTIIGIVGDAAIVKHLRNLKKAGEI